MKNFKTTILYLAVAALLGGYIYFFERGPVKSKDEEKKTKVFSNFVADDITDIRIENLGTTLAAEKTPIELKKDQKGAWEITSPKEFKADDSTVRSALSGVGDLNPDTTIDNPPNLKDYGLDPANARCTLKTKNGTAFVLLIGDKNISNSSAYVKTADKNTVYLVASYAADNLRKRINDYRDHSFFKTDTVLAQKIRVQRGGHVTVFEKDKDNNWNISEPVRARADASKVRDLLNNISSLRIEEFVNDHPSNLSSYGLSSPRIQVEVWNEKEKTSRGILIGKKKDKTANLYAMEKDNPSVYLVGEYFDKSMDIKLTDYRDKTTMQFDGGAVKSLTVKHGVSTVIYSKDDKGQWSAVQRPNAPTEAAALISQLSGITISDFAQPEVATGVNSPIFTVEVLLADGSKRIYRFGKMEKDQVYLASDKGKDIFLVPATVVSLVENYYNSVLTPVAVTSPSPAPSK